METFKIVLDALFALGGVASLALLAWGGRLVFVHSRGFVGEGQGRFEHRHRRRARQAARFAADDARTV